MSKFVQLKKKCIDNLNSLKKKKNYLKYVQFILQIYKLESFCCLQRDFFLINGGKVGGDKKKMSYQKPYNGADVYDLMARKGLAIGGQINTSSEMSKMEMWERMNRFQKESSIRIHLGAHAKEKIPIYKNDIVYYSIYNPLGTPNDGPLFKSSTNGLQVVNSELYGSEDIKEYYTSRDYEMGIIFSGLANREHKVDEIHNVFDMYKHFDKTVQGPVSLKNHCHPGLQKIWEQHPEITTRQELDDAENGQVIDDIMAMGQASHDGMTYEGYINEWDLRRPGTLYDPRTEDYMYMQGFTMPLKMRSCGRMFARMRERRDVDDRERSMQRRLMDVHGHVITIVYNLKLTNDGKFAHVDDNVQLTNADLHNLKDSVVLMSEYSNYTTRVSEIARPIYYCLVGGNFEKTHTLYVMGSKEKNGNYEMFYQLGQI